MHSQLIYLLRLFIVPAFLALAAVLTVNFNLLPESLYSFTRLLVWLVLLVGLLLTLSYARTRNLVAILITALTYWLLTRQVQALTLTTAESALNLDAPLSYLLISLLLPILITLNSLWSEKLHLLQDLVLRLASLAGICLIFYAIAISFPLQLTNALSTTYWPAIYIEGLGMAQLPQLTFLACCLILLGQFLRNPQPYFAAQLIALIGLIVALPKFTVVYAPALSTLAAVVILALAVLQEAFHMAFRDDLTGLPGRRALNERLQRLGRNYSLAMADVDHFKKFNDTYGHDLGDQVLKMVATQLGKVSGGGKAYRYGGEEFTLVFPNKTAAQALPYLEKLRMTIENYTMQLREENLPSNKKSASNQVAVTISLGIAERSYTHSTPEEVIKAADEALYSAKKAGRNQTVIYTTKQTPKKSLPAKAKKA